MKTKRLCKICKKEFEYYTSTSPNRKFCSKKCRYKYKKKNKIRCKVCKKKFEYYSSINPNRKFCSIKCRNKDWKKNKIGFWDSEIQSKLGKKGGKKTAKINKKNKTGFWNPNFSVFRLKGIKKGIETNRKNKTSIFSPKIRHKAGKRTHELHPNLASERMKHTLKLYPNLASENGRKSAKILREKKGYIFYGIHFDSKSEMEIGMCIHYQLEKIKEGKNYQFKVDNLTIDFFIQECFVEYHPYNTLYDNVESYKNWGIKRRKVLNNALPNKNNTK